jgi:hypothetical protein
MPTTTTQPVPAIDSTTSTRHQPDNRPRRISTPMVAALEGAWAAIRAHHADLPPAVIILGAGSVGVPAGVLKLGHFAAMRWRDGSNPAGLPLAEVFIGGEGLAHGPTGVLGTLLHEAAHALAHVRDIKDTSRQGRWHNVRFKQLAEEVGIQVTKDPRIGWSPTTVTDATEAMYGATIAELGRALRLYRSTEATPDQEKKPTTPPCVCGCGRKIRVSAKTLAAGPISCGLCGEDFEPETQDQP